MESCSSLTFCRKGSCTGGCGTSRVRRQRDGDPGETLPPLEGIRRIDRTGPSLVGGVGVGGPKTLVWFGLEEVPQGFRKVYRGGSELL